MGKTLKVIVTVRGGNVVFIHASSELLHVEFTVLDYDNIEQGNSIPKGVKEAEGEIKNKQLVEVY